MHNKIVLTYRGAMPNAPATYLTNSEIPAGTVTAIEVKLDGLTPVSLPDDVVFNLALSGGSDEFTTELTVPAAGDGVTASGLSLTISNGDFAQFKIDAPFTSGSLEDVLAISFELTYQTTVVELTGAQTVAGVKTFSSSPIVPTPSGSTDAANKAYVDASVAGLSWKQSVRAATTANGTLASDFDNGSSVDGVTLATGDRILLKNQSTGSQNGIYVVAASGSPTRATDADTAAEILQASVYVQEGTTNADTQWVCTTNAPITLGSTSLTFAQLSSGGGGSTAADISIDEIGTATYDTVADHLKIITSPGWISGGTITDSGSAEIDVAAGTGFIRATDGDTDTLYSFDWAGVTNQAITADSIRYVGVQYNAGSPQVFIKTTDAFDYDTEFPLGVVVNEGGTLYIANRPWKTADALADIMERFDSVALVTRDNRTGGLILGNTGTRNVTVSAGALLSRLSEYSVAAIDTSASSTFDAYYRNGSGGWTKQAAQTQWNNSNYDDGDGTLGSLTSNRYTSRWFYLTLSGALVMVYGQAEYQSLANALNEGAPSSVPNRLTAAGILIGRIIAQQGSNTPGAVQTAFTTSFSAASVTDFSQLSGTVSSSQIADESVTYAKMQNVSAASKLLGRGDSGSGDVQEITLGTGLSMSGTTLNSSGGSSVSGGSFDIDCGDATGAGDFVINCGDAT